MLYSLAEDGRMAVILPHGVLFRGASEARIRKQIIDMNLLDAVIGLPEALFYGTGIPACIMVFKKNRTKKDVIFIDVYGRKLWKVKIKLLREEDIEEYRDLWNYESKDKYSYVSNKDEKRNLLNLDLQTYEEKEEEEPVDMKN